MGSRRSVRARESRPGEMRARAKGSRRGRMRARARGYRRGRMRAKGLRGGKVRNLEVRRFVGRCRFKRIAMIEVTVAIVISIVIRVRINIISSNDGRFPRKLLAEVPFIEKRVVLTLKFTIREVDAFIVPLDNSNPNINLFATRCPNLLPFIHGGTLDWRVCFP
jgi:hypothetical protein